MGWLDIAIVAVLVGCVIFGYRRGLVQQLVELAGLLTGVLLALYLTGGLVANYAKPLAGFDLTYPVVFLAIVGVALLVAQVVGRVTSEVMQVTFFGWFDQVGGGIAGLAKGLVWLSICITIASHLHVGKAVDDNLRKSSLAGPLSRLLPAAFELVKSYAHDAPLRDDFRTEGRVAKSSR
jgi:membrane protein required for colicin V production